MLLFCSVYCHNFNTYPQVGRNGSFLTLLTQRWVVLVGLVVVSGGAILKEDEHVQSDLCV